jgi:hypothetical protein
MIRTVNRATLSIYDLRRKKGREGKRGRKKGIFILLMQFSSLDTGNCIESVDVPFSFIANGLSSVVQPPSVPRPPQVNGLVGRRNAIAHGDASTTAAYTDIDRYLIVVSDLSRELDAAVAHQLQSICRLATLPW